MDKESYETLLLVIAHNKQQYYKELNDYIIIRIKVIKIGPDKIMYTKHTHRSSKNK